jgi:indolepyruvate ferredoxin oxidoreductase alpha subunit
MEGEVVHEYSVNEKIALEVAHAAALSGVRSIASMKHLGLNVAADPASTMPYVGVGAGLLIVSAGDPGCHTSPNEQDQRMLAKVWHMPCLDPESPQVAHDMARDAFALSEASNLPVLIRITTRISHARSSVRIDHPLQNHIKGEFPRTPEKLVPIPANARRMRGEIEQRLALAESWAEESGFNHSWTSQPLNTDQQPLLLISSGAPSWLLRDSLKQLSDRGQLPPIVLLTLGMVHPFPTDQTWQLLSQSSEVLVVEELSPFIEEEVRLLAQQKGWSGEIHGMLDDWFPNFGELSGSTLEAALSRFFSKSPTYQEGCDSLAETTPLVLPPRPPTLCSGCPHRGTYLAMRVILGAEPLCFNDIGCYTLGYGPPFNAAQSLLSMGSSISQAAAVSRLSNERTIAFIGDSTFFHAGMPALANIVEQDDDVLVVVLDNRTTAMTGFQPSPTTVGGLTGRIDDGEPTPLVGGLSQHKDIAAVCHALGVPQVEQVEALNLPSAASAFRHAWAASGPTVLVAVSPCPINEARHGSAPLTTFRIDSTRCRDCAHCSASNLHCGVNTQVPYQQELVRRRQDAPPPSDIISELPTQTPCSTACPLNICIQGYVGLAAAGDFDNSLSTLHQRTPFPAVLSRVCHHPCQTVCVRAGKKEGAVPVNAIKKLVVDTVLERDGCLPATTALPSLDISVAVVGAGPAGLAAAHDLAVAGYSVHLFDRESEPGGLLAHAIPAARLPRDLLRLEVERVLSLPITFHGQCELGVDINLTDLLDDHSGVVLALGASKGILPEISGLPAQGVEPALDLLRRLASGEQKDESLAGLNVVVIGGGDAAIDAVRCSQAGGASNTTLVYRRGLQQMSAAIEEVAISMDEGMNLITGAIVDTVLTNEDGRVCAVNLSPSGLIEDAQPPKELQCDLLLFAIGQSFELPADIAAASLSVSPDGSLDCDKMYGGTDCAGVFVAGDLTGGPRTVVEALASGRRAAAGLDSQLAHNGVLAQPQIQLDFLSPTGNVLLSSGAQGPLSEHDYTTNGKQLEMHIASISEEVEELDLMSAAMACHFCSTCGNCSACLELLDCPAIQELDGKAQIIEYLCTGCSICADLCPNGAISEVRR